MPVGSLKNTLYGLALPVFGKRCIWRAAKSNELEKCLQRHRVVGACIQTFINGRLADCYTVGSASPDSNTPVSADTVFRTASIAKMVTALLVFRLQTKGQLNVDEDVSDFLGYSVRHPAYPDIPITLGMLLSHTSSMVDSQAYFASFTNPVTLQTLVQSPDAFMSARPGKRFRYSNLAAGMIGCMLEKRFGMSFEQLAQQELFAPLGVQATFDASTLQPAKTADSWRVLPPAKAFDASQRICAAVPGTQADADHHYLLASGGLFVTATDLAKLTLAAWNGAEGFISAEGLRQMQTPLLGWPDQTVSMQHGMGLFKMEDSRIFSRALWGHQGFAYGAVNGVFFDEKGSGFVCLNSGASEQRIGHLACLNRDLIALLMREAKA